MPRWYSQYEDEDTGTLTREEWGRLERRRVAPVATTTPRRRCPTCRAELGREPNGRARRGAHCSSRCAARDRWKERGPGGQQA